MITPTKATLGAINLWLQEAGYNSELQMSYRRGHSAYASTPNITMIDIPVFLKLKEGHLRFCRLKRKRGFSDFDETLIDLCDPRLFEILTELLGAPDTQPTSEE